MTAFWVGVAIMSLIASLLLAWPIWRRKVERAVMGQDQLNVAIFEDRMKELDAELASGVLTVERHEQARNELQRDLLQNAGTETAAVARGNGGRWAAPLLAALVPALAVYVYLQVGSPEIIDKPPVTAAPPQHQEAGQGMAGDMQTMVQRLQDRLRSNPEDVDGWVLLGRSMVMLRRYQEAADAYGKAYELVGDVPEIMAQYAETLALAQEGSFQGRPSELLQRAKQVDPEAPRVMWLLGVVAAQQGDTAKAAGIWQRLLKVLPADSEAARMVKGSIDQLGGAVAEQGESGAVTGSIALQVDISPELKEKTSPEDVVFIFARPVQGPRMPLAAVRHRVGELPLAVTLDDSMSMTGKKLSSYEQVEVVARISKSASPMPQAGDLEGSVIARTGDSGKVVVNIDHVRQ
ncbi:MAG TPA: c-type cytochrome biogenesis protein CcmI [Gammaproteobacteria bacterium]|nr:c-type cytochrome biogenesis protein CcmI [Gammaproteobacteria bacterium]